jgi:NAD(P)-dependent dehydrogenase (short-subunit alcohol dehydrogenase family)
VLRLARDGATVVGCDADPAGLQLTEKVLAARAYTATLIHTDLSCQDQVDQALRKLPAHRLDLLANIADTESEPSSTRRRAASIRASLITPMRLCVAAIALLRASGRGVIVNVSATGGLAGFTRSLSSFFAADAIRAIAICSGGATGKDELSGPLAGPSAMPWSMTALAARADDIAELISWLATSEADDLSGAVLAAAGTWADSGIPARQH